MRPIENAYHQFCRKRFAAPSEAQVTDLERRINATFPDDYLRFLLTDKGGYFTEPQIVPSSQGCPTDRLSFMHGIGASHRTAELATASDLALFDDNDPPQVMPIGYTLMGGLILLNMPPGEGTGVIVYKKAFGDFYFLANDIEEFFGRLKRPRER
jgi:hypothetical protein